MAPSLPYEGPHAARPLEEWYEEIGDVLWWVFDEDGNPTEAPWVGSPLDLGQTVELYAGQGPHKNPLLFRGHVGGWPGYHTHWTPIPMPASPRPKGVPPSVESPDAG